MTGVNRVKLYHFADGVAPGAYSRDGAENTIDYAAPANTANILATLEDAAELGYYLSSFTLRVTVQLDDLSQVTFDLTLASPQHTYTPPSPRTISKIVKEQMLSAQHSTAGSGNAGVLVQHWASYMFRDASNAEISTIETVGLSPLKCAHLEQLTLAVQYLEANQQHVLSQDFTAYVLPISGTDPTRDKLYLKEHYQVVGSLANFNELKINYKWGPPGTPERDQTYDCILLGSLDYTGSEFYLAASYPYAEKNLRITITVNPKGDMSSSQTVKPSFDLRVDADGQWYNNVKNGGFEGGATSWGGSYHDEQIGYSPKCGSKVFGLYTSDGPESYTISQDFPQGVLGSDIVSLELWRIMRLSWPGGNWGDVQVRVRFRNGDGSYVTVYDESYSLGNYNLPWTFKRFTGGWDVNKTVNQIEIYIRGYGRGQLTGPDLYTYVAVDEVKVYIKSPPLA